MTRLEQLEFARYCALTGALLGIIAGVSSFFGMGDLGSPWWVAIIVMAWTFIIVSWLAILDQPAWVWTKLMEWRLERSRRKLNALFPRLGMRGYIDREGTWHSGEDNPDEDTSS